LNPRERVSEALDHREPDRPPVDLGGAVSGIHNKAYSNLIRALKLDLGVSVYARDAQQLAQLDEVVLARARAITKHLAYGLLYNQIQADVPPENIIAMFEAAGNINKTRTQKM